MNKFLNFITAFIFIVLVTACTKQNEPTPLEVDVQLQRSDDYFTNLRAYKKSPHQVYFGWFGGTGTPGSPDFPGVLDGIPDSVDIVSLWGGIPPVGSYNHELLKKTQQLKGTRFVHVFFPNYFDGFNFPKNEEGVKLFADTLIKINTAAGLDGIDIDYEAHVLSIFSNDAYMELLISELGKHFGPKSKSDKLLIIDSFTETIPSATLPFLDYYVIQNYSPQGGTVNGIQGRLNNQVRGFPVSKCIITENFESLWSTGGLLWGFAGWNPDSGSKGGAGSYHTEYEYALTPDYYYTRRAIQIMNPAAK